MKSEVNTPQYPVELDLSVLQVDENCLQEVENCHLELDRPNSPLIAVSTGISLMKRGFAPKIPGEGEQGFFAAL